MAQHSDEAVAMLVDPSIPATSPGSGVPLLSLPDGVGLNAATEAVEAVLATPEHETVCLVVGDRTVGCTSRAFLAASFGLDESGSAADARGLGDGDGASLPGTSGRFVLLRYTCDRHDAAVTVFRIVEDDPQSPRCPVCGEPTERRP